MNFPLSVETISKAIEPYGPIDSVRANWPLVEDALDNCMIYSPLCAVGVISTIAVETGCFSPIKERGGPAYLTSLYEGRKDLGNDQPGDGVLFRGRGFVQITGRADYARYGQLIGRDIVSNPDLVLQPAVAAAVLATYFFERKIRAFADAQNWEMVRRRVDGGLNGWPRFIDAVSKLTAAFSSPQGAGNSTEVQP
jgi:hypothetical protein